MPTTATPATNDMWRSPDDLAAQLGLGVKTVRQLFGDHWRRLGHRTLRIPDAEAQRILDTLPRRRG